jgi:hypothetical protein
MQVFGGFFLIFFSRGVFFLELGWGRVVFFRVSGDDFGEGVGPGAFFEAVVDPGGCEVDAAGFVFAVEVKGVVKAGGYLDVINRFGVEAPAEFETGIAFEACALGRVTEVGPGDVDGEFVVPVFYLD